MQGWIKLHRSILKNPTVMKSPEHLSIWVYLLLNATHSGIDVNFGGKRITLNPGEFTTGRKKISTELHISESKVQRVLKEFESEQQIEQRTDRQCRLISIVRWDEYQHDEQRDEQQVNNDRTTSEQRVNTKQECKKEKNDNNVKNIDIDRSGPQLFSREGRDLSGEPKTVYETYSDAQGYLEEMRKRMREKGMA